MALLSGCVAWSQLRGESPGTVADDRPSPVELARTALSAGNLEAADAVLAPALAPVPTDDDKSGPAIRGTADTAELLVLRAELRIRQARFPEAESDALTAMALVPATASTAAPEAPAAPAEGDEGDEKKDSGEEAAAPPPPPRPVLDQRTIHFRLARLYEDAGRDDATEQHLAAARELCLDDPVLVEADACERERQALVRVRLSRGRFVEAEPLVLAEISDVQSRYGPYDLRLSTALCHVARFYARQGKYVLSGPLFARSFDLWKTVREEALAEHKRALAAGGPSPFGEDFLRPRAGHAPFAAPCGLEDQPLLFYKLGKAGVAADAIRYEEKLWEADTEAGPAAVDQLNALVARGADPLDVAAARHAVAFIARRKGDMDRAELETRAVVEAYAAAWPTLPVSERRYRTEDYLGAMEELLDILRATRRYAEAIELGEKAEQVAAGTVHEYDSLRLDTLLSAAKTFREMRDARRAEAAAARYLDAIVAARGDRSADYAWALRTISYAYLLRDELDASGRMEMQAKAIWAKQSTVAPAF